MYVERHEVAVKTAAGGAGAGYTRVVSGRILAIRYVKDPAATAYADTVDFTITSEATGANIWTEENVDASKTVYPRAQVHSTAGVGLKYDVAGAQPVAEPPVVALDRVKVAVAAGGDLKTGTFHVLVG